MGVHTKSCVGCQEAKLISEFPKSGTKSDGTRIYRTRCKACCRSKWKADLAADPLIRERRRALAASRRANPEKREVDREAKARWRRVPENREREMATNRAYQSTPHAKARAKAYRESHKEMMRTAQKRWRVENIEHARENDRLSARRRRARKFGNGGGGLTRDQWHQILQDWNAQCAYCGTDEADLEIEHVVPLSRGGPHDVLNIVPACQHCNRVKYTSEPEGARDRLAAGLPALEVYHLGHS